MKNEANTAYMVSEMSIQGGLMGLKTENVEKVRVFQTFLKGAGPTNGSYPEGWGRFDVRKGCFSLSLLCVYFQNCASCRGGEHNFMKHGKNQRKIVSRSSENKKLDRNGKNEEQIMNAKRVQT